MEIKLKFSNSHGTNQQLLINYYSFWTYSSEYLWLKGEMYPVSTESVYKSAAVNLPEAWSATWIGVMKGPWICWSSARVIFDVRDLRGWNIVGTSPTPPLPMAYARSLKHVIIERDREGKKYCVYQLRHFERNITSCGTLGATWLANSIRTTCWSSVFTCSRMMHANIFFFFDICDARISQGNTIGYCFFFFFFSWKNSILFYCSYWQVHLTIKSN